MTVDDFNLDAISTAIRDTTERHLPDYDYEAVGLCVAKAIAQYAIPDSQRATAVAVEEKFEMPWGGKVVSGVIDLVLAGPGNLEIIDWKFRNADSWAYGVGASHADSWQGRIYALHKSQQCITDVDMASPPKVIYRAATRLGQFKNTPQEPLKTHSIGFQLETMFGSMDYLAKNHQVWPRNRPSACNMYGRPCPHLKICQSESNDLYQGPLDVNRLSHSDMSTFMACNERWRLDEVRGEQKDVSEDMLMGLAFHRGMAEVYGQIKEHQNG